MCQNGRQPWAGGTAHELLAQIIVEQDRALAEIGGEGDDLAAVSGLQPFEDDRGVEPSGISEDDFLHFALRLGHGIGDRLGDCGKASL